MAGKSTIMSLFMKTLAIGAAAFFLDYIAVQNITEFLVKSPTSYFATLGSLLLEYREQYPYYWLGALLFIMW